MCCGIKRSDLGFLCSSKATGRLTVAWDGCKSGSDLCSSIKPHDQAVQIDIQSARTVTLCNLILKPERYGRWNTVSRIAVGQEKSLSHHLTEDRIHKPTGQCTDTLFRMFGKSHRLKKKLCVHVRISWQNVTGINWLQGECLLVQAARPSATDSAELTGSFIHYSEW